MRISLAKIGRAFILAGALAFACWGYLVFQELWFQRVADRVLESQRLSASGDTGRSDALSNSVPRELRAGDVIGRLQIPRLHLSVIILEGSDSHILRVGAGHVQGTALPGNMGNVGIAAHRDTFFRPLREIHPNDVINLTTFDGVYRYRVDRIEIVAPDEIQVLRQSTRPELTLVTCYPFYYIGSAPKRFIVHASQQS